MGNAFERVTHQLTKSVLVVFNTIRAGYDFSARIGSRNNRIIIHGHVLSLDYVFATFIVRTKLGEASIQNNRQKFRARKVLTLLYHAPTDRKYKGQCEHITIAVNYGGEITTYRYSLLLW